MSLPELQIRNLTAKYPVIQAGMGVLIGNADLAAATIKAGGYGVISTVGLGLAGTNVQDYVTYTNQQITKEINKAKELLQGSRNLGVNIMAATTNFNEIVKTVVAADVDFIISGAGMPLKLPALIGDADIAIIPVVSSPRALKLILKSWIKRYNRKPDAVIIEGVGCGGHLGFSTDEIETPEKHTLPGLYSSIKNIMQEFECSDIPLIAAGEISHKEDIEQVISMGYQGVQIGTKFITTKESGIHPKSKEYFINADDSQVVVITSPVGMPVRVLRSPLVERILSGKKEQVKCRYHCLRPCNPQKVSFCIAQALVATVEGDIENGLFMTGCNVASMESVYPVAEFFQSIER